MRNKIKRSRFRKGVATLCMMLIFYYVVLSFIYTHFIHSWISRLFQVDFVWFIVYSQIVRTRQIMDSVTHVVLDVDREIVLLDDFLHQNICAVSLECIILPIKSDIMWISPAITFACKKNSILLPFKVQHHKCGISDLFTHYLHRLKIDNTHIDIHNGSNIRSHHKP